MREKKRRKWTAAEKLRIVLTCMQPGVEVSEVCRREGISPKQPSPPAPLSKGEGSCSWTATLHCMFRRSMM